MVSYTITPKKQGNWPRNWRIQRPCWWGELKQPKAPIQEQTGLEGGGVNGIGWDDSWRLGQRWPFFTPFPPLLQLIDCVMVSANVTLMPATMCPICKTGLVGDNFEMATSLSSQNHLRNRHLFSHLASHKYLLHLAFQYINHVTYYKYHIWWYEYYNVSPHHDIDECSECVGPVKNGLQSASCRQISHHFLVDYDVCVWGRGDKNINIKIKGVFEKSC